jgi:hypothetical protein
MSDGWQRLRNQTEAGSVVAVRCLPGVGRITLLEELNHIRELQRDVRVGDAGAFRFSRDYLTWVTDASRVLSGLISSLDVDILVLSDRYRLMLPALLNLSPHYLGQELIELVQLELDERANALDGLISELEQLGRRWPGQDVFVAADTSFLLEADKKLDEYDFASLLDLADKPLHLFVPMAVVDELDKTKSDRARGRARSTLAILDETLVDPGQPANLQRVADSDRDKLGQITIELLLDPPGHTRMSITDDEIIDRVSAVASLVEREITLLTCDTGMAMRARAVGLPARKVPAG